MGTSKHYRKYFLLWPLALLLCIASPVQAVESVQEVEIAEEIKLYAHLKTNQTQKPQEKQTYNFTPRSSAFYINSGNDPFLLTYKKYLFHCNLIFYE